MLHPGRPLTPTVEAAFSTASPARTRTPAESTSPPTTDARRTAVRRAAPGVCTHGNRDRRKPGARREQLVVVTVRRVQISNQAWRVAPCWIDERVQPIRVHGAEHRRTKPFAEAVTCRTPRILLRRERLRLGRCQPNLYRRVEPVRSDQLGDRLDRNRRIVARREVPLEVEPERIASARRAAQRVELGD